MKIMKIMKKMAKPARRWRTQSSDEQRAVRRLRVAGIYPSTEWQFATADFPFLWVFSSGCNTPDEYPLDAKAIAVFSWLPPAKVKIIITPKIYDFGEWVDIIYTGSPETSAILIEWWRLSHGYDATSHMHECVPNGIIYPGLPETVIGRTMRYRVGKQKKPWQAARLLG